MIKKLIAALIATAIFTGGSIQPQDDESSRTALITVADTIIMMAEIYGQMTGDDVSFKDNSSGYRAAEDYATEKGIMPALPDESYLEHKIVKSEFVYIIKDALKNFNFEPINTILDGQISDVNPHRYYADAVYSFARAGIIACEEGLFNPNNYINAEEAESIIRRIQNENERVYQEYKNEVANSDCVIADDSFYISPVGHTRFTNVYVSTSSEDGYIEVQSSDYEVASSDILGWYDEHKAELYIAAKKEGFAIIILISKDNEGNILAEDKLKITVEGIYNEASKATINVPKKAVVKLCQDKSVIISFDIPDNENQNVTIRYTIGDPEIVKASWTDWESYNAIPLNLQGVTEGETIIYIELFDEDTGCYLTGASIYVVVTEDFSVEADIWPRIC